MSGWGVCLSAVGVLFIYWGRNKSTAAPYRLLVARSRLLWGDRVHGFFQVAGTLMVVAGALVAVAG